MPERIIMFFQPVRDRWSALDRKQQMLIAAVAMVVLIALIITIFLTTRTTYQLAIRDLDPIDANQVSVILTDNEIRHRQIQDGLGVAIEVERDKLNEARILVETRGLVPDREFTYEDALEFSGIGATETVTRNNLLRARQSDLEAAIMSMDSVLGARVELALPDANRFFIQTTEPARASVVVRTTRRLSPAEARGIATFVRNSVLGLELENIEVVDSDFNVLFSGMAFEDEDSMLSDFLQLMQQQRIQVEGQVRDQFRHLFDVVEVAANLRYRQEITEAERLTLGIPVEDMEQGVVLNEHTLSASAQGQQAAFAPGLDPNTLQIPTYPFGVPGDMRAQQQEATRVFGYNELREVIREVPNSFERDTSTVSVALTRFVPHRQESLMRQNGGNFNEDDWDDFQRTTLPELVSDEALIAAYTQQVQLGTGIDNVFVAVWNVPIFIDYEPTPLDPRQIIPFIILALLLAGLLFGLIRRTQQDEEEEIEPELSVEDLLVSTQMEEAMEDEILDPIGFEEGTEAKRKLDEFIDDKPEAAASLLRHWLNESEF